MRFFVICGVALLALAGAARADVFYALTFTNGSTLGAEGTFSAGAASSQDPGYFLLTGLRLTALRESGGALSSLAATSSDPGSAYDPTTEAFIDHVPEGPFGN
jgi:hypothetical protein